jgi:hypothetical protein
VGGMRTGAQKGVTRVDPASLVVASNSLKRKKSIGDENTDSIRAKKHKGSDESKKGDKAL